MLNFLLYLRILFAHVLVLDESHYQRKSPFVVAYMMKRNDIPFGNLKSYKNWEGECYEKDDGGRPFTKVFLWESHGQWIGEGKWKEEGRLLGKLENCKDIIEINIDGGTFNEYREPYKDEDVASAKDYAKDLVSELQNISRKRRTMTITWYDNSVYGMDLPFGPYPETKKFTWKWDGVKNEGFEHVKDVEQLNYLSFYIEFVKATCPEDAECIGILAAYSRTQKITCETLLPEGSELMNNCTKTYRNYSRKQKRVDDSDESAKTDTIESLVSYFDEQKEVKKLHGDAHYEL